MTAPALKLFQIAYSPASLAAVEPGYTVLDNLANPRPDWYEYGPVRQYLQTELQTDTLDERAFYAFFSTKFAAKTGWRHADVVAHLQGPAADCDVALFSAHPNQMAFFLNVFEQGEFFHAGLIKACRQWLDHAGIPARVESTVMDARQTVFCNYFAAKPAFWRAWLALGESLFAVCEGQGDGEATDLQRTLTAPTTYTGGAQLKIFLMERLASLALALDPRWKVSAADPYVHGHWPSPALRDDPTAAICSDALKHAFRTQPFPEYMTAFGAVRQQVLQGG